MPTIKDVAKDAGVSPSTVSRVINDHARISDETKERVRDSMKKIGYHPNSVAQNLVNQKTNTIGLVMPYSTEKAFSIPFYSEVLRGIGAVAQKKGYSLLLLTCNNRKEELDVSIKAVKSKQVDGLLILRTRQEDILLEELKKLQASFVIVGRPEDGSGNFWINNDNVKASKNLVQHLIDLGHHKIAMLTGTDEYIFHQDRLTGYKLALEENELEYNPELVKKIPDYQEKEHKYIKQLLENYPDLTAIFASDDIRAYSVIKAINSFGLKVPDDIAVVGFNNNPLSKIITPSLTTVDINIYELGSTATKNLIRIINDDLVKPYHKIVPTDIIIRESCGAKVE